MQVTATSAASAQGLPRKDDFAKIKQSFKSLDSALQSGDLSAAKDAFAELQKNAPVDSARGKNPLSDKIDKLGKVLDEGDTKAAQAAFSDIKKSLTSQRPPGGGRAGGPPPGGASPAEGAGKSSASSSSSSSSKVYDKKDTNKDGKISLQEDIAYSLKTASEAKKNTATATTNKINSDRGLIDAEA